MVSQLSARRRILGSTTNSVGLLLSQICRAHRNHVAAALDEIRVHVGQDHFVHRLAIDEGITQTALAEALCVDTSTVTKTLLRLERDGLVKRKIDSGDGRVSRVYLTTRGRTLVKPVVDIWANSEKRLMEGLSKTEQAQLRRLLRRVLTNLSSLAPGERGGSAGRSYSGSGRTEPKPPRSGQARRHVRDR